MVEWKTQDSADISMIGPQESTLQGPMRPKGTTIGDHRGPKSCPRGICSMEDTVPYMVPQALMSVRSLRNTHLHGYPQKPHPKRCQIFVDRPSALIQQCLWYSVQWSAILSLRYDHIWLPFQLPSQWSLFVSEIMKQCARRTAHTAKMSNCQCSYVKLPIQLLTSHHWDCETLFCLC